MGNSVTTNPPSVEWETIALRKTTDREQKLTAFTEWRTERPSATTIDVAAIATSKLSSREREIVHLDATAIVQAVAERKYTSVEVLTAFAKAAVVAQDNTNCLTEIFIHEGLERAKELDEYIAAHGRTLGPLHGLPVSIKDHIKIKGLDTSTGYTSWAYRTVSETDAIAVDILKKAGAVLYVKTANPQTLLSLETNNNVFGRTTNPFNTRLTPGGSSGGESSLIAQHGSPIGIGTDIGGSIRIPAAHCGLYGLKGSVARLPHAGLLGSHDGMDAIVGCVGPIATSARDLALFSSVMLATNPWLVEPSLIEIPWRHDVAAGAGLPAKLSIAIMFDDGVVHPHPPITDALNRYKQKLVDAGHDVVEWKPLEHKEGWDLISKLYLLDSGKEYYDTMAESGEPPVQQSKWMLDHAKDRPPYTVSEIFKLNAARESFRARAIAHWTSTAQQTSSGRPIDVILCPVAPTLAPPHDTTCHWSYTSHWNLLDLPGVVFPVGKLTKDTVLSSTLPPSRNPTEEFIHKQWHPETYISAPIALQLVGRRHNEERLLAILNVVEEVVGPAIVA